MATSAEKTCTRRGNRTQGNFTKFITNSIVKSEPEIPIPEIPLEERYEKSRGQFFAHIWRHFNTSTGVGNRMVSHCKYCSKRVSSKVSRLKNHLGVCPELPDVGFEPGISEKVPKKRKIRHKVGKRFENQKKIADGRKGIKREEIWEHFSIGQNDFEDPNGMQNTKRIAICRHCGKGVSPRVERLETHLGKCRENENENVTSNENETFSVLLPDGIDLEAKVEILQVTIRKILEWVKENCGVEVPLDSLAASVEISRENVEKTLKKEPEFEDFLEFQMEPDEPEENVLEPETWESPPENPPENRPKSSLTPNYDRIAEESYSGPRDSNGWFKCTEPGCAKAFKTLKHLKNVHSLEHDPTKSKDFHCEHPGCGKSFYYLYLLNDHRRRVGHGGKIPRPQPKTRILCPICGKSIQKKSEGTHMACHKNERNFKCEICGCGFNTKQGLDKHVNIHTRDKLHMCHHCGKTFLSSNNLKSHRDQVHSSTKAWICSFCGRSFSVKRGLTVHERRLHLTQGGGFPCDLCTKTFFNLEGLNKHKARAHPEII